MLRLDSVKIEVPEEGFIWHNTSMPCTTHSEGGEVLSETYTVPKKELPFGVRSIQIRQRGNTPTAIIETSAKVLRDEYYDMLNLNTADRYIHEVNKNGYIQFNHGLIDSGKVLTMDVTQNLQVNDKIPGYIQAMACVPITDKYNVTAYRGAGNHGIVWAGKQKTFKERQIFYDKMKDIARDTKLRTTVHAKHLKKFEGVLRVEGNFTTFKTIRKYTGTENILGDVLNSKQHVNLQLFDKITRSVNTVNLQLLMEWDGMKLYQVEKLEGRKNIIRALDYDMVKIQSFIKNRVNGNVSGYVRDYRLLCDELRTERGVPDSNVLAEIRQYMLSA